jgi:diaminohydroxyphosphoribosylaminopyrimidine deaminase/5-amino-6-(5-phosphoribosylamino)uracil reductase
MQMQKEYDEMFMQKAISLAKKGWGKTGTNPLVGAIVVKNNKIISQGFHRKRGEAHAEVCALADAGTRAQGTTLYINLEPCCCAGHTPPCVEAICKAKIKRVVIGMTDPNPLVNGKGITFLKQNNIDVTVNILSEQANQLNVWYKKYITTKIPYIILKIAISKNGKISGFKEKYITSEPSRKFVHSLRGQVGAVMVGINTVLADNPYLTDRLVGRNNPVRVVIDPHLQIPLQSNFFKKNSRRIIITQRTNDSEKIRKLNLAGTELIFLDGDYYPIETVIQKLGSLNIGSLLIEGGAILFSQFLDKKMYDELFLFVAPRNVAGGIQFFDEISKEIKFTDLKSLKIGEDSLYHVYRHN